MSDKIKVVLDTNIVVSSALAIEGNPAKIFELILLEEIESFTSKEILDEIKNVLSRPKITKRTTEDLRDFIIENFEKFSEVIKPKIHIDEIKDDPDDNKFLECAISANANYIISGDDHLLRLKEFKGIKIVNPSEFLETLEKKQ